ncbi:MAG: hypothetical protein U0X39_05515 [Bacteroidales bacterium]
MAYTGVEDLVAAAFTFDEGGRGREHGASRAALTGRTDEIEIIGDKEN